MVELQLQVLCMPHSKEIILPDNQTGVNIANDYSNCLSIKLSYPKLARKKIQMNIQITATSKCRLVILLESI